MPRHSCRSDEGAYTLLDFAMPPRVPPFDGRRCRGFYRTADEILQHAIYSAGPPGLQLSDEKWSKVQSSAYYSKFPGSRLLPANALSQTLQATYKSGCLLYSQFVPQSSGSQPLQPPQPSQPPRFYSPREMARLMGFPESFALPTADGLAHRQLGNAVVPPLIGALGVAIAHALQGGGGARTIETCEAIAVSLSSLSRRATTRRGRAGCPVWRVTRWVPMWTTSDRPMMLSLKRCPRRWCRLSHGARGGGRNRVGGTAVARARP